MLYTGKGDNGKTGLFGTKEKLSKSSPITEALGSLDEANSFLGICKAEAANSFLEVQGLSLTTIIEAVQNNLFVVQAQVAGADKHIASDEVAHLERMIGEIEKQLAPITSFLIPGATTLSAHFDFARTLVRRAERKVVAVSEDHPGRIHDQTLAYLNRLSSLLYACARFTAEGKERAPTY